MTLSQQIITIAMCVLGTYADTFSAILQSGFQTSNAAIHSIFKKKYCLVRFFPCWWSTACDMFPYCRAIAGLPELIAILRAMTVGLHLWKKTNVVVYCRRYGFAICFLSSLSFKKKRAYEMPHLFQK